MGELGISEFTFGFGFLSEQTQKNWSDLRVAPVLPSLQQEQHEGWDAKLPLIASDYYYQFKISDYLERTNAKFIADGTYTGPYYRVALHRRNSNQQHRRLKIHASTNSNTFYVAPEFHHINSFNSAFLSRQLLNRSRIIPIRDCKHITDSEQHYITFRSGDPAWKFHSDPETHDNSITGDHLLQLYQHNKNRFRNLDDEFTADLFFRASESAKTAIQAETQKQDSKSKNSKKEQVASLVQEEVATQDHIGQPRDVELLDFDPEKHERREVLKRTSQVLSVFFGLTLVLVGEGGL